MSVPLLSHLNNRGMTPAGCCRGFSSLHPVLSSLTQHPDESGLMSQCYQLSLSKSKWSLGLWKDLETKAQSLHVQLLLTSWGGEKDAVIFVTQDRVYLTYCCTGSLELEWEPGRGLCSPWCRRVPGMSFSCSRPSLSFPWHNFLGTLHHPYGKEGETLTQKSWGSHGFTIYPLEKMKEVKSRTLGEILLSVTSAWPWGP